MKRSAPAAGKYNENKRETMKIKKSLIYLLIVTGVFISNCSSDNISNKDQGEIVSVLMTYYSASKKADYDKKYELICEEDKYILNKKTLIEKWAHDIYYIEFISIKNFKTRGSFIKVNINAKIGSIMDGKVDKAVIPVYLTKESDKWKIIYQNDYMELLDSKL